MDDIDNALLELVQRNGRGSYARYGSGNDTLTGMHTWKLTDYAVKMNEDGTVASVKPGVPMDEIKPTGSLDTSRILFKDDISPKDVTITFEGNNLIIGLKSSSDTITIPDMGRVEDTAHRRQHQYAPNLEFADGTFWNSEAVIAKAEES